MYKYFNLKMLILILILSCSLTAQNKPAHYDKIMQQTSKAEKKAAKLPANEKKIASIILDKVNLMTKDKAKSKFSGKAMVNKFSTRTVKVDGIGRLRIRISLFKNVSRSDFNLIVDKVKRNNGKVFSTYYPESKINWRPEIHCFLDYDIIKEIAKDNLIANIATSIPPIHRTGSVTTEGDTQLFAALARTQKDVDGSGITVGVISDGRNDWESSRFTGDLPQTMQIVTGDCTGVEGTAMMEIIYDIAPGVSFAFGSDKSYEGTSAQMCTTISSLINPAGCKVIVDDVGFLDDPWFSDGALAQHIRDKIEYYDITYVSSAGNDAEYMWGSDYNWSIDNWHDWYNQGSTENIQNHITIDFYDTVSIFLQWADNWDNADSDYNLYLINTSNGDTVGSGGKTVQGGNNNSPIEIVDFINDSGPGINFAVMVKKVSGDDREIKLLAPGLPLEYNHSSSVSYPENQVYGHPAALGVISVAAYSAFKPDKLEPYSSRGPTNIWTFPGGTLEIRDTPSITATDSCLTTIVGFDPFAGTSASAPHIAGIAALYYDKYSTASPEDFYNALTGGADDIDGGTGGTWNNQSGYGKANAYEALGGGPLTITVHQINSGFSSTGSIDHWENNNWQNYPNLPHPFPWELNSTHTLKATQEVISNEKYREWVDSNDSTIYINHSHFTIDQFTSDLTAFLKPAKVSTIETELISGGSGPDVIEFKDPWYEDLNESPYGYKNRGISAIFHEQTSPLNLTLASDYKGVFLDQSGPPFWDPPYYSVNAGDGYLVTTNGIYEFSHWAEEPANSAEFEDANARETAVVFRAAGATVKALYQKVNSIPNYTVTISQGEELTIPAGANFQCAEGFTIEVEGSLIAEGTKEQPINITGSGREAEFDPMGPPFPLLPTDNLFVLKGINSNIVLNHVKISDTYCAFTLQGNNDVVKIKNSEITETNIGVLLSDFSSSQILLDSLYLHNNHVGISLPEQFPDLGQESSLIINRSIFDNTDYGVFIYPSNSITTGILSRLNLCLANCVFYNMGDWAIYLATPVGSYNFGRVYSYFIDNIFYNSNIAFRNKFNNPFYLTTEPNVLYNSTSTLPFYGAITSDPLFVSPAIGDFHLKNGSPAINSGTEDWYSSMYFNAPDIEVENDTDPDGTIPDIGSHFHPQLQGTISEDMTIGGEIQILNYLNIADGVTLTIEENSTVFVNAYKRINVYGSLIAHGTAANKIKFTRSDPNNISPTYWQGIYGISADNLNLRHCEIEGAMNGSYIKYEPASFDNVKFETCNTGIKFYYSDNSNVTDSEFNNCGNAINYSHSTAHLNNNTIENCDYGIWSIRGYGNLRENSISNNDNDGMYLTDMSGLQLTAESEKGIFPVNNVIENNQRYGVYISSNSNPNLGTYFELPEMILGGFNEFNCSEGDYDIYSLNESIIKAEVNYWPGEMNNNGIIDVNPTVDDLGESMMAKITGLGKFTSNDSLENIISTADSLAALGNYRAALALYKSVISAEPDKNISIKALIRIVTCFKETNELSALLTELDDIYRNFQTKNVGTAALDNSVTIYALSGDYTEALSRIIRVIRVYIADPTMIEQTAAALYQQAMIYETLALLRPGLGKDALLANRNLCITKIINDYPDTDIAKYLILFEGYENLYVEPQIIPDEYVLNPAFPNPFNSTVNFSFGLKEDANVDLVIYDILGRKVWKFKSSNKMEAGYHNVRWHGTNTVGNSVASGLYLVKFKANKFTDSQKIILVK